MATDSTKTEPHIKSLKVIHLLRIKEIANRRHPTHDLTLTNEDRARTHDLILCL